MPTNIQNSVKSTNSNALLQINGVTLPADALNKLKVLSKSKQVQQLITWKIPVGAALVFVYGKPCKDFFNKLANPSQNKKNKTEPISVLSLQGYKSLKSELEFIDKPFYDNSRALHKLIDSIFWHAKDYDELQHRVPVINKHTKDKKQYISLGDNPFFKYIDIMQKANTLYAGCYNYSDITYMVSEIFTTQTKVTEFKKMLAAKKKLTAQSDILIPELKKIFKELENLLKIDGDKVSTAEDAISKDFHYTYISPSNTRSNSSAKFMKIRADIENATPVFDVNKFLGDSNANNQVVVKAKK